VTQTSEDVARLFTEVLDPANRPDPYPLYARMRESPVAPLADGFWAVSTHEEITALLHHPGVSKEQGRSTVGGRPRTPGPTPFLFLDPPAHDRLRRLVMRRFTPARVAGMHARVVALVDALLDAQQHHEEFDVVDDFAYPLPVTVICELLGVPREDEQRFHVWADVLAHNLDPDPGEETISGVTAAQQELSAYIGDLVAARRAQPTDDLLSELAVGDDPAGRLDDPDLVATMVLLLIAGHETTVNLITNGVLTLLRHPTELDRLRRDPVRAVHVVEELLRYEPPVQFAARYALTDIDLAGATIPQGAGIRLMLAAGNRDPRAVPGPDRFDPGRGEHRHLGFGGGVHYCVGAPLARLEGQVALTGLARRVVAPRLLRDPPPYRPNAVLRGPEHLPVGFAQIVA
jgi:cytochrome P450